jgi:quercetin dioxygenase-like cupin family protein
MTQQATSAQANLAEEVESIVRLQEQTKERLTRPLVGFPNLKVVLVSMASGSQWPEHSTTGRISVHCLRGHIRLRTPEETLELITGGLAALESNIRHDVEAVEASVFLLTVAKCEEKP